MKFKTWFKQFGLMEGTEMADELKRKILSSQFYQAIRNAGGKLYFVGGAIRDLYIGKASKDIDIIVANIPKERLQQLLMPYGRLDSVGASFGIIKFKPREFEVNEPLDIAIPRTERPMTEEEKEAYKRERKKYPSAYQAFTVEPKHDTSVEDDLARRDFTINAMAHDSEGNLIDPYNGFQDIRDKRIRMVNPKTFSQDPLRMLRAIQFAARFGFEIDPETFQEIQRNVDLIDGIPGERILIELQKIVEKAGDQYLAAKLLDKSGLWREITNLRCDHLSSKESWFKKSKDIAEFLFLMFHQNTDLQNASSICQKLKCESDTIKGVRALYEAWDSHNNPHAVVFRMHQILPQSMSFTVVPERIADSIHSRMPKSYRDLQVDGNDMLNLGFKGEKIKAVFDAMLQKIFDKELLNVKEDLLSYANKLRH